MLFAPDTEDTLEFCVDLLNTVAGASRSGAEELSAPSQLTALLAKHRYAGRFDRDELELSDVIGTRERLRRIWSMHRDDVADEVNQMLREAHALTQLKRHDESDWHLHATPENAPLAERIRVETALALADVVRTNENDRLRSCAADDCAGLFIDLSRNGSKRFCSVRCGNRMNQIAYRTRQADEE